MSDGFRNFQEQQKRMQQQQEQQRKVWQDYLHRQEMYVHYKSMQEKKIGNKGFFSCGVCGSVLGLKVCPICKKFFCGVHLACVKTAFGGHNCVSNRPLSLKPNVSSGPLSAKPTGKTEKEKLVDLNSLVDWFSNLTKDIPLSEEQDLLFSYLLAKLRRFPDDSLDWLEWLQEYDFKT